MRVLVVGANGNMGRRYCSILEYLDVEYVGVDLHYNDPKGFFDRIIIATPTDSHIAEIRHWSNKLPGTPILCEKPISKYFEDLAMLPGSLCMVNNYAYMPTKDSSGTTTYSYYKSGNDGLYWDCIQLIGLAKGMIILDNLSPIWRAMINGTILEAAWIDTSYVNMIEDFIGPMRDVWGPAKIIEVHEKVLTLCQK